MKYRLVFSLIFLISCCGFGDVLLAKNKTKVANRFKEFVVKKNNQLKRGVSGIALASTVFAGSLVYQPPSHGWLEQAFMISGIWNLFGVRENKMSSPSRSTYTRGYITGEYGWGSSWDPDPAKLSQEQLELVQELRRRNPVVFDPWEHQKLWEIDGETMDKDRVLEYIEENTQLFDSSYDRFMALYMEANLPCLSCASALKADVDQAYFNIGKISDYVTETEEVRWSPIDMRVLDRLWDKWFTVYKLTKKIEDKTD